MGWLDETVYLNASPDYVVWNEQADAPDEVVENEVSFLALEQDRLKQWNRRPLEVSEEEPDARSLRHVNAEALRRLESGARSEMDFKMLVAEYDRIEKNKRRSLRMNELLRVELPGEHEVSSLPTIFPAWMNMPLEKQLRKGDFIDALYDCPYALKELLTNSCYSRAFDALTIDQKFVAYYYFLRQWKTARVAKLKGSSSRAIRKVKAAVEKNVQAPAYRYLLKRAEDSSLSNMERLFLQEYAEAMAKPDFSGGISRTLKRDMRRPAMNRIKVKRRNLKTPRPDVDERGVWQLPPEADSEGLMCVTIGRR